MELPEFHVLKKFRHGWRVEIWSYKEALSEQLIREQAKTAKVTVHLIDDYFSEIAFWAYYWTKVI